MNYLFTTLFSTFKESEIIRNSIGTALLILIALLLRSLVVRAILRSNLPTKELKRKWVVQIRNSVIIITVLAIIAIWGSELRAFAVSVVALAAAIVIATKELILCILGGLLRTSFGHFDIGDRIEISGIRGDVIGHNLFVTTVYEIGPGKELHQFTGRVITIPNSLFLSQAIVNETATGKYVLDTMRIPLMLDQDWRQERHKLMQVAQEVCAEYLPDVKQQYEYFAQREGIETPTIEPRVSIHFPEAKRVDLILRLPVPAKRKGKIEQQILDQYSAI